MVNTLGVMAQSEDIFGISRTAKPKNEDLPRTKVYRSLIEQFAFEFSTGAGLSTMNSGFFTETPSLYPIPEASPQGSLASYTEENPLTLRSSNLVIPMMHLGVRVDFLNFLTFGAGYAREYGQQSALEGDGFRFEFHDGGYQINRIYGSVGLILWDAQKRANFLKWRYSKYSSNNLYMQSEYKLRARAYYPWRLIAELEYGRVDLKNTASNFLLGGNTNSPRWTESGMPSIMVSLRFEKELSDYSKLFIKAGVDTRTFSFFSSDFMEFQDIQQRVYALNFGLSVRFPTTKRCKVGGCGVVMRHRHEGRLYRGSSIFNRQERKIGEWH